MNSTITIATVLGAGFGFGLWLTLYAVLPAAPSLGAVLSPRSVGGRDSRADRLKRTLTQRLAPYAPAADLRILGKTPEEFIIGAVLSGLFGLALPAIVSLLAAAIGLPIGVAAPVVATLAFSAGFVFLSVADVKRKATNARRECRRAICSYLDLVAAMQYNGHGAAASLMRASKIGHGWVFERLRETLLRAQLEGAEPWERLRELGDELGVEELAGIGDVMKAAGVSGAHVYQTLRARAKSLREQVLSDQLTAANSRTTAMEAPVALTLIILMIFMLYPFVATIAVSPAGP